MAVALAEAGADIIAASAGQEEHGSDIEGEVTALGHRFAGFRCDFADRSDVYSLVDRVNAQFPVVDILINNAGTVKRAPAAEYSDEDWDRLIEINLTAQFILAREFGKRMLERGSGKIIFTASLLSFQGGIRVPAYTAAKGGVAQLAKAFANEWAGRGVQVNAIAPGYFVTDNTEGLVNDPVRYQQILDRIPAGRWGDPDDLKGAVVYLASRASDYVSGMLLTIDGGWMGR
jgi:2-deoxy-D-gluconate 3-dehydrogenase